MSQEYSCVDLLQLTEAEKKEGMEQLKAYAKKYAAHKAIEKSGAALKAAWQSDIGGVSHRTMTDRIDNFMLCKRVVVEHPVIEPAQTAAEKDAKFLAEVAEGDRICCHVEKTKDDATNQYPFQGRTFEPSHTFQPQLSQPSWEHSDEPW